MYEANFCFVIFVVACQSSQLPEHNTGLFSLQATTVIGSAAPDRTQQSFLMHSIYVTFFNDTLPDMT